MEKMTLDIQRFNSTNKTTHYELSQYVSSDKPTYLVDYNDDMEAIDTGIYEAKTQADLGVNNASVAQTTAETAQTTANTAVTNAGVAQTTADANSTKIGELANLTTTNKSNLVGAISEVNDKIPQMMDTYTSSTTDGYSANYLNGFTEDSGWIEPTLNSKFENYSSADNRVKYRKVGKFVMVIGEVKPTAEIASGNTAIIFNLPAGFRPIANVDMVCQGSSVNKWTLSINNAGDVTCSRYGTTSQTAIPRGAWLPFSVMFMVD